MWFFRIRYLNKNSYHISQLAKYIQILFYKVTVCLGIRHLEINDIDSFSHKKILSFQLLQFLLSQDKTWAQSNLFTRVVHSSRELMVFLQAPNHTMKTNLLLKPAKKQNVNNGSRSLQ